MSFKQYTLHCVGKYDVLCGSGMPFREAILLLPLGARPHRLAPRCFKLLESFLNFNRHVERLKMIPWAMCLHVTLEGWNRQRWIHLRCVQSHGLSVHLLFDDLNPTPFRAGTTLDILSRRAGRSGNSDHSVSSCQSWVALSKLICLLPRFRDLILPAKHASQPLGR